MLAHRRLVWNQCPKELKNLGAFKAEPQTVYNWTYGLGKERCDSLRILIVFMLHFENH